MGATAAVSPCDIKGAYRLCRPISPGEWETYHRIRRDVLLEARKYAMELRDELSPGHHPHLLWRGGQPIGCIRIDVLGSGHAALRLVAIDPSCQRQGHGLVLLDLAEDFARRLGCTKTVVYATPEAAGFYSKAGYVEEDWDSAYVSGIVQMAKPLR